MSKLKITIFFLTFFALVIAGHAAYTIWSNTVTDNVDAYAFSTLTKDSPRGPLYSNVTFSGTLKLGNQPLSGTTVQLWGGSNPDNATWSLYCTNVTDINGAFQFTINRTQLGTFYYAANYMVSP